jgi:hypothetical protein
MDCAWVRDAVGRGGPAVEVPGGVGTAAPLETDRGMLPRYDGGTLRPDNAGLAGGGGAALEEDGGRVLGPEGIIGGGPLMEGMLPELAVRLGGAEALGGGGVARTGALLLGSFLLTHFFSSVS